MLAAEGSIGRGSDSTKVRESVAIMAAVGTGSPFVENQGSANYQISRQRITNERPKVLIQVGWQTY